MLGAGAWEVHTSKGSARGQCLKNLFFLQAGPGSGKAAGRGIPAAAPGQAPAGLAGPVRGLGGPGAAAMRPQARSNDFIAALCTGLSLLRSPCRDLCSPPCRSRRRL